MEGNPNYEELVEAWRAQNPKISRVSDKGGEMEREHVESSNINEIGYDPESQTLEIEFLNGSIYQYFDVPEHVYTELRTADSKGEF